MKFTKIWLLAAIFLMGATGLTQAAVYTWGGGDGNWKVAGYWGPPGGPPNGYDEAIIPSGNVTIDSTQYSVSQLTLGAGAGLHIPKWGLMFDTEAVPYLITVTNNGTIDISPPGTDASGLNAHDCVVTLTGGGEIELGGNLQGGHLGNGGYGGSFINDTDHTIRGGGSLECNVTNKGKISADNGTLVLNGTITNQGGAISIDQAAAVIRIGGNVIGNPLQINDGTVVLQPGRVSNLTLGPGKVEVRDGCLQGNIVLPSGTQFTVAADKVLYLRQAPDGTTPLITNNTTMLLDGAVLSSTSANAVLTGPGRLVLGGDLSNVIRNTLINDTPHTIEGGGQVGENFTNFGTIENKGKILANNGVLRFFGMGGVRGDTGVLSVTDNGTLELIWDSEYRNSPLVVTGDFSMSRQAVLKIIGGDLEVKRNFTFAQTDPAKWNQDVDINSEFIFSGAGATNQSLEVGGRDLGESASGFVNNFNFQHWLTISGNGTYVYLVDAVDNGHRSSGVREALYCGSLKVASGATLNLNGLHLYTHYIGDPYLVKAGDGWRFGGGQIIDVPVGPGKTIPPIIGPLLLD